MREEGAAKVRFPQAGGEAILINTGGGLAGGDAFTFDIAVGDGASLTVTTQAAERVYRTLGPPAELVARLSAGPGATLCWLPQETILFDGASLSRRIEAELASDARLLMVEAVIFGRTERGELVRQAMLRDRWRIRRGGKLVFADDLAFAGPRPASTATLGKAGAVATVLLIGGDAESHFEPVRTLLGPHCGASAWSGKLIARLTAGDGFALRKLLVPLLGLLAKGRGLPKIWSS
ncbi:MAG: urease accessory protein UreD [Rhizobiales bacterium]|nr:urease accessory protein UreD [Hyphomicrobiales bacterium]MBI3672348.1 urease accessory protein UreD [Hyphomicrobiales bacterium]